MELITFNKLPEAVGQLLEKVTHIEILLADQQQSLELDEPLNIKKAATFLDLAVPTLYSKVSRKEIPVNKRGKRLYFYKSELEEWIRQGRKRTYHELSESFVLPKRSRSRSK